MTTYFLVINNRKSLKWFKFSRSGTSTPKKSKFQNHQSQLQILVLWGPCVPPVVVALKTQAENPKTAGQQCADAYRSLKIGNLFGFWLFVTVQCDELFWIWEGLVFKLKFPESNEFTQYPIQGMGWKIPVQTDETREHHVHSGWTSQYLRHPSTSKAVVWCVAPVGQNLLSQEISVQSDQKF